jgi:hypothetical protein
MGKSKGKKTPPALKTDEERATFVHEIKEKFYKLGCFPAQYDAMDKFFQILDDYEKEGVSASGKISFPECPFGGRDIMYLLNTKKHIENAVHFMMKSEQ